MEKEEALRRPSRNGKEGRVSKAVEKCKRETRLDGRRGRERWTPREDCQIHTSMSDEHILLLSSFKPVRDYLEPIRRLSTEVLHSAS